MNELINLFDSFRQIRFYDEDHSYWTGPRDDPGSYDLKSCTTLIGEFKPPFEADKWATIKAEEKGITAQQQKWAWEDNLELASYRGTRYHLWAEDWMNNKERPEPFLTPEFTKVFRDFYDAVFAKLIPIKSELVVGNLPWRIAGQVDQLFYSKKSGMYHLADWKTNKAFYTNKRYRFNPPLAHVGTSQLWSYSLQLSIYELIIKEAVPDLPLGAGMLVWFDEVNHKWEMWYRKNLYKEARIILDMNKEANQGTDKCVRILTNTT